MGGQYSDKIALAVTRDMLDALKKEAKRGGRSVLAQIRHYCNEGLKQSPTTNDLEKRLAALEAAIGTHAESPKGGLRKVRRG